MVVRFTKTGNGHKLLDRTARWTPDGWDPSRWVPRHPKVPRVLLDQVEAHMSKQLLVTP